MLKKARNFLRVVSAFYSDTIVTIVPEHIQYSFEELLAVLILAEYYCHPSNFTNKISRVVLEKFRDRIDVRAINNNDESVAASWLAMRAMQVMNETMISEANLESAVEKLMSEISAN